MPRSGARPSRRGPEVDRPRGTRSTSAGRINLSWLVQLHWWAILGQSVVVVARRRDHRHRAPLHDARRAPRRRGGRELRARSLGVPRARHRRRDRRGHVARHRRPHGAARPDRRRLEPVLDPVPRERRARGGAPPGALVVGAHDREPPRLRRAVRPRGARRPEPPRPHADGSPAHDGGPPPRDVGRVRARRDLRRLLRPAGVDRARRSRPRAAAGAHAGGAPREARVARDARGRRGPRARRRRSGRSRSSRRSWSGPWRRTSAPRFARTCSSSAIRSRAAARS